MSDDFKDEVTEVQLDPPLVVHKKQMSHIMTAESMSI